ncbi:histone-lysine N-methyltransferase SETD1B-like [Abrus precatorius]|uniref:Histone-lysine N-methyltransferase SETD1B-like n=1 Tax=Abrus precatorius TaxID=3816 RepID=A0A8B8KZQ9_ABRPR|nr:histone-lysine N-methyltransferase SETD1B-like [Abrus precatorius]
MEDKRITITNKRGKKKIHPLSSLSIGGEGGIVGLLVFGGALAIAGFMAVASFASKKRKGKGTHDHQPKPKQQHILLDQNGCKSEEDHEITQTLTSLLQHSTIHHEDATCCWTSNKSIDQEEKIELKPSSVEESPTHFKDQQTVFSDNSHPENAVSSNQSGVAEECLMPLLHNSSGQAQEVEKDEARDGLTSSETEDDDNEEDVDDDDDDMMSDNVSEIGEEDSSKEIATTSLSLNYNKEQVWHADRKFKGEYCDSQVCNDSDEDDTDYGGDDEAVIVGKEASLNEKVKFSMVANSEASIIRSWVFPLLLLALVLLLVLLTRRPQESFYVLDDSNSVLVP